MLIGTIVALITLLVGFLSGRTMGLADQNVSDVTGVRADRIVFSAATDNETLSYAGSAVTGPTRMPGAPGRASTRSTRAASTSSGWVPATSRPVSPSSARWPGSVTLRPGPDT